MVDRGALGPTTFEEMGIVCGVGIILCGEVQDWEIKELLSLMERIWTTSGFTDVEPSIVNGFSG